MQVVFREVLDIGIRQPCERGKDEQVSDKLVCLVGHIGVHHRVYLLLCDISPVHAFGRIDISCKWIERQTTVIPCYGDNVFQHNHVAPNGIGTAFLLRAQKILEVVDECKVQFFQRNILTLVGMGQELTDVLTNGHITLERSLCSAVSHFLGKLGIVLLEEF